jgi:transmembrane sensor
MNAESKQATPLAHEAAAWASRLRTDDEAAAQFDLWLNQDDDMRPRLREFYYAHAVDTMLERHFPKCPFGTATLIAEARKEAAASGLLVTPAKTPQQTAPQLPQQPAQRRTRRRWQLYASAAASVAALALTTALLVVRTSFNQVIETSASEWSTHILSDGSVVRAGPLTSLRVAFDDDERLIGLTRGEAFFKVASDRARPFVVQTQTAHACAVGTQFSVSRRGQQTVVTVAEGTVAVARGKFSAPNREPAQRANRHVAAPVTVTAGNQLKVAASGELMAQAVDIRSEMAWLEQRLILNGESIGYAVAEFNRRNRTQIQIDSAELAGSSISGVYNVDDPEAFAEAVTKTRPATLRKQRGVLLIESEAVVRRPAAEGDANEG